MNKNNSIELSNGILNEQEEKCLLKSLENNNHQSSKIAYV